MEIIGRIFENFLDDPLVQIAAGTTVAVLLVSVAIYFKTTKKQHDEQNKEKCRAITNLCFELYYTLDALNPKNHPNSYKKIKINYSDGKSKIIYFTNILFNHDFYDSMINSGMINFLETKLQQKIQNVFRIIKMHNEFLYSSFDTEQLDTNKEKNNRYYEWMSNAEIELKNKIPSLINELEKEYL